MLNNKKGGRKDDSEYGRKQLQFCRTGGQWTPERYLREREGYDMVFNIFAFTLEVRVNRKKRNEHKTCYEKCLDIDEIKEQNFLRHYHDMIRL